MVDTETCRECGREDRHAAFCSHFKEGSETPKVRMVADPHSGDVHRAQDILDEVQAVLKKYGYALVHKPHAIVLAKVEGPIGNAKARAIAEVQQITPFQTVYREIDWSKRMEQKAI